MDKVDKKSLIKSLLSGRLTKKQRTDFADLEPINIEIRKQWDESGNRPVDMEIKEQIWKKVRNQCEGKKENQVLVGLRWIYVAASLALLLGIAGLWKHSLNYKFSENELVKVTTQYNTLHILPDSSKVWMEPGSSIEYYKDFNKDRKVWLSGNSLFEVFKRKESPFQVHINDAFIEVKGTCFLVKQENTDLCEVTLFKGKVEFNIQSTQQTKEMFPSQKLIYNSANSQTQIESITNINWENGKYTFKDIPLNQLIEFINQKYDSDIVLKATHIQQSSFSGNIRHDEKIDEVLYKICYSLNLNKKEEGSKIIVY
ncbi:FecR family protein [uncultured Bacteroides sp.]|uniref:FecR family protein n=1 Tax=uncultured Bacteroides sp. TaxID=162156 RepID=UPI0034277CFD